MMVDVVIVRFDEGGELSFHVHGSDVQLLIVDERCPVDRVYEWTPRDGADEIAAIVPVGETIGNSSDERHEVLAHRITQALTGKSHLESIT